MDNRKVEVISEGKGALALAMQLVWPNAAGGKATHYVATKVGLATRYYANKVELPNGQKLLENCREVPGFHIHHFAEDELCEDGVSTLILLWHAEGKSVELPFPMTIDRATEFVGGWLEASDYGHQPDHDGDNGKGFRVFNDHWGHVAGHHYGICGVQPAWAMYGK